MALAEFAISGNSNKPSSAFIETVNQNRVLYEKGFQRYKSRIYKHHWTHSSVNLLPKLNKSWNLHQGPIFFTLKGVTAKSIQNALVVLPVNTVTSEVPWTP